MNLTTLDFFLEFMAGDDTKWGFIDQAVSAPPPPLLFLSLSLSAWSFRWMKLGYMDGLHTE